MKWAPERDPHDFISGTGPWLSDPLWVTLLGLECPLRMADSNLLAFKACGL